MNAVNLLVWERGSLRPYNGSPLHGGIDFYAWRVRNSSLVCVAAIRSNPSRRVDMFGVFRDLWLYLRSLGVRAMEISSDDDISRREIVALFQGFNSRPVK